MLQNQKYQHTTKLGDTNQIIIFKTAELQRGIFL